MKWLIIGLLIGIVSFIPGISGGTIMYLSGEFDNFTYYLSNIKKYYSKILLLLIGALIGVITFAKMLEYLFRYYPNITKLFFAYLVLFSLPEFFKKRNMKLKVPYIIIAIIILFLLNMIVPTTPMVINNINISIPLLICLFFFGFLDGFITIIPGISGSMIMMILGPYYLYKSISANVLNKPILFIPLLIYFLGDFLGIFLGAKFTTKVINKYPNISNSLILGFIVASIFIILPISEIITIPGFIALLFAYILISLTTLNT